MRRLIAAIALVFATACVGGVDVPASQPPASTAARTPTIPAAPTPGPTAPGQAVADSAKVTRVPVPTAAPLFSGYRLEIQQGTFWEYRWVYTDRSCAQGRGCSTEEDRGLFRVTLASPRTVEVYRANLMTKMQASSLSELVRLALAAGVQTKS